MSPDNLAALIQEMKEDLSGTAFEIQIRNSDGVKVGTLRPINKLSCKDPSIIASLTKWRKQSMHFFFSQFDATEERTELWLKNTVLPNSDRVLFLIEDNDGKRIGNAGVCNLSPEQAELDNFIRGESGGDPNLVLFAELSLLSWLYFVLEITLIKLHVFSNNWIPINMHLSVGFEVVEKAAITKRFKNNEIQYVVDSTDGIPVKYSYLRMELKKELFAKINTGYIT